MEGAVTEGGFGTGERVPASGPGLRPLGVGETLDTALKLYRNNAVTLWKIVAVIIVPLQVLDVIVRRVTLPSDVYLHDGQLYSFTGQSSGAVVAVSLVTILVLIGSLVATGATFWSLVDAYLGRPTDWRTSLEHARTRLGALIWLSILSTVFTIIGFFLLLIPGVWFLVSVSVAVPVLMLEGTSGFAAMKRSIDLVDTRWWATLIRLLAAYLLLFAIIFGLSVLIGAIASGVSLTNVTLFLVLGGVVNAIVSILVSPFVAAVISVIYIDLRVRKEGFDLELLAAGFHSPGSTIPAGSLEPTSTLTPQPDSAPPPGTSTAPPEPTWPPAG